MTGSESDEVDGPVTVDVVTTDGPELSSVGGGAIKISVGQHRLNQFVNEESTSWGQWDPEYVGDFVAFDLPQLLEIAVALYRGNVGLYDTETHTLTGFQYYFLFEPLGESTVRIAFRTRKQTGQSLPVARPTPQSARGYVVESESLVRAFLAAYDDLLDAASEHGVASRFEASREQVETTRTLLEE